jgi:hypothetical protein
LQFAAGDFWKRRDASAGVPVGLDVIAVVEDEDDDFRNRARSGGQVPRGRR